MNDAQVTKNSVKHVPLDCFYKRFILFEKANVGSAKHLWWTDNQKLMHLRLSLHSPNDELWNLQSPRPVAFSKVELTESLIVYKGKSINQRLFYA